MSNERWYNLKRKYGLSEDDYMKMLKRQGGVCAICRKRPRRGENLCVDHSHTSPVVRGLLCKKCNMGLGLFNDDASLLARAARYLTGK